MSTDEYNSQNTNSNTNTQTNQSTSTSTSNDFDPFCDLSFKEWITIFGILVGALKVQGLLVTIDQRLQVFVGGSFAKVQQAAQMSNIDLEDLVEGSDVIKAFNAFNNFF